MQPRLERTGQGYVSTMDTDLSTGMIILFAAIAVVVLVGLFLLIRKARHRRQESRRVEARETREQAEAKRLEAQRLEAEAEQRRMRAQKNREEAEKLAAQASDVDPDS